MRYDSRVFHVHAVLLNFAFFQYNELMSTDKKVNKGGLLAGIADLFLSDISKSATKDRSVKEKPIAKKDTEAESQAVVENVVEELHEEHKEALNLQHAELSVQTQMLRTQKENSELSMRIFKLSLLATVIALLSLLVNLMRS